MNFKKFKYTRFNILYKSSYIEEGLTYYELCVYLVKNRYNLFGKYVMRVNSAESWGCEYFLRYESSEKI